MCTCMATIHLHQRGSDDASADPLVPWLRNDCPTGSGGCPMAHAHPWPLGSPGEDQGDAFCHP